MSLSHFLITLYNIYTENVVIVDVCKKFFSSNGKTYDVSILISCSLKIIKIRITEAVQYAL